MNKLPLYLVGEILALLPQESGKNAMVCRAWCGVLASQPLQVSYFGIKDIPICCWFIKAGMPSNPCVMAAALESGNLGFCAWAKAMKYQFPLWDGDRMLSPYGHAAKSGRLGVLQWVRREYVHCTEPVARQVKVFDSASPRGRWETHMFKPDPLPENKWMKHVCLDIAECGTWEMLRWALDEGCPWEPKASYEFAKKGDVEGLDGAHRYCRRKKWEFCAKFMWEAAEHGHQNVVQWGVDHGFELSARMLSCAANHGQIDMMRFLFANDCPKSPEVCEWAASAGNLDALVLAFESGCPMEQGVCYMAALEGHGQVLDWAIRRRCPTHNSLYTQAAAGGFPHIMDILMSYQIPWSDRAGVYAVAGNHVNVLQWIKDKGLPFGMEHLDNPEDYDDGATWNDVIEEHGSYDAKAWLQKNGLME